MNMTAYRQCYRIGHRWEKNEKNNSLHCIRCSASYTPAGRLAPADALLTFEGWKCTCCSEGVHQEPTDDEIESAKQELAGWIV